MIVKGLSTTMNIDSENSQEEGNLKHVSLKRCYLQRYYVEIMGKTIRSTSQYS